MTSGVPNKPKPPSKLGAEKLTPEEQRRRFEELARELECDESEEQFDKDLRAIARQKSKPLVESPPSHESKQKPQK